MLAYILALAVGLGSLAVYMAAFFFPEVHRKNDFIWSGIGLFYALVLWVCAGRITGGVLLGQVASVGLIGWLGWETLKLRRELTPAAEQTAIPNPAALQEKLTNSSIPEKVTGLFTTVKDKAQQVLGGLTQGKDKTEAGKSQQSIVEIIDNTSAETVTPQVTTPSTTPPPSAETVTPQVTTPSTTPPPSAETVTPQVTTPPPSAGAVAPEPTTPSVAAPLTDDSDFDEDETVFLNTEAPELVRPNPPDPELVEAAIEDAEEKHLPADPPEPAPETSTAHQESENPPNPT